MKIDKTKIKKILFITLSNIGDVILSLPVLGVLKREFPQADITVITGGAKCRELFEAEPRVSEIIVYDKRAPLLKRLALALRLGKNKFDLAVDLRNSIFPLFSGARYRSPLSGPGAGNRTHMKDRHLKKIEVFGFTADNAPFTIALNEKDRSRVKSLLGELGILASDKLIAVSAGAKSHTKRWPVKGFIGLCERLSREPGAKVLLIGDESDASINKEISCAGIKGVYDLTGRTNLRELAYLLSLCRLLVTNDSAPLHAASCVNLPTVAIFGPTDHKKYGPLAPRSAVVRKGLSCSPCERPQCRFNTLACMAGICDDEVWSAVKETLDEL